MGLLQDLYEFSKLLLFFSLPNHLEKDGGFISCINLGVVLTFGVSVVSSYVVVVVIEVVRLGCLAYRLRLFFSSCMRRLYIVLWLVSVLLAWSFILLAISQ